MNDDRPGMDNNLRNTGKKYEDFVGTVFDSVLNSEIGEKALRDVKVPTEFGERQIDILVEGRIAGRKFVAIIECKDQKRAVDIQVVDAFHSLIRDVAANKGVLVSRSGFSKSAQRKAKKLGIDVLQFLEPADFQAKLEFKIPVIVVEYAFQKFDLASETTLHTQVGDAANLVNLHISALEKIFQNQPTLTAPAMLEKLMREGPDGEMTDLISGINVDIVGPEGHPIATFKETRLSAALGKSSWLADLHSLPPECLYIDVGENERRVMYSFDAFFRTAGKVLRKVTIDELNQGSIGAVTIEVFKTSPLDALQSLREGFHRTLTHPSSTPR